MDAEQKINDVVKNAVAIELFDANKKTTLNREDKNFKITLKKVMACFENSFISPAFGVSLHEETLQALTANKWVKLVFDKTYAVGDLHFNALLFRADDCYGVNLIRQNNGEYSGRCIYLNFLKLTNLSQIF